MRPIAHFAEGVETAPALVKRAKAEGVELPVAMAVTQVLDGSLPLGDAVLRFDEPPAKARIGEDMLFVITAIDRKARCNCAWRRVRRISLM